MKAAGAQTKAQDPPESQTPIFPSIDGLGTGTWTRMRSARPEGLETFNALPEPPPLQRTLPAKDRGKDPPTIGPPMNREVVGSSAKRILADPHGSEPSRTPTDSWDRESEPPSIEARIRADTLQGQETRINMERTYQ